MYRVSCCACLSANSTVATGSSRLSQMVIVIDNKMMQSAYYMVFVKLFLKQVMQSMRPSVSAGGIFTMISYSDTARAQVNSATMTNPNPQTVLTAIDSISADSSTAKSDPTAALNLAETLIQGQYVNGSSPYHASVMISSNSQDPAPQAALDVSTSIISQGGDVFGVALGGETVSPMLLKLSKQPSTQFMMAVSEAGQVESAAASVSAALFPGNGLVTHQ